MSNNYRTFKFRADTIDGKIQQFPQYFLFRCGEVKPIGVDVVRQYDGNECIVAMRVFLVLYNGQLMGNKCFKTFTQFMSFLRGQCNTDYISLNGCVMALNGCSVTI